MAKGKGLLGSGSSGRTGNPKFAAGGTKPGTVQSLDHSANGDPDVVAARRAVVTNVHQTMKAKNRSKSTGLKV